MAVPPNPRGCNPHCSNEFLQRQALCSQALEWPHTSLQFGIQDISDHRITHPVSKYLVSIYDMLEAVLVHRAPSLPLSRGLLSHLFDMLHLTSGIHTAHLGSIKAMLGFAFCRG